MATFDAAPRLEDVIISSNTIDESVLHWMETDLENHEILSCLFFLIEDYSLGYKNLSDIGFSKERLSILKFVKDNKIADWEDKIMEALCLLQNYNILHKLGIRPENAKIKFSTAICEACYSIDKYAKAFYTLFESLSKENTQNLLSHVYRNINTPNSDDWPERVSLELHLLWWIHEGFVKISKGSWRMDKLLKILKELDMSSSNVYQTLRRYNAGDGDNGSYLLDDQGTEAVIRTESRDPKPRIGREVTQYQVNNGLVVIFNQMKFTGPVNYDYRCGSQKDCSRILDTFGKTFGFETKVHTDLGAEDIYLKLDDLSCNTKKYDCVAVFILSHGTNGNIVASDGVECPIRKIETKLCSRALIDKPKILVIQACQKNALTTDGPSNHHTDIGRFEDLLVLSSTIPGQLSIRDREKGTWFIEVLCEVLIEMEGESILDCLIGVNSRFKNMIANIDGRNMKQVPRHHTSLSKRLIFTKKTGLNQRET